MAAGSDDKHPIRVQGPDGLREHLVLVQQVEFVDQGFELVARLVAGVDGEAGVEGLPGLRGRRPAVGAGVEGDELFGQAPRPPD